MVKPNRDELHELTGGNADIRSSLNVLLRFGVQLPLITLGSRGAAAYVNGTYYRYATPGIAVRNSVGSGDSTVAGIAVGLSRGLSPELAIKLGMAAGTVNAMFDQTGMVTKELVEQYYNKIGMEDIISKYTDKEMAHIDKWDFYERTRNAYAVVMTSEKALYANILLKKGVVV